MAAVQGPRFVSMRPKVGVSLTLLMAGALVLLAVGSRAYYQVAAVEHLQQQIETAEEEQVPQLLAQLCALGEPGIRALVANLDSSNEPVALSARRVLLGQLARWRNESTPQALRRYLLLAKALREFTPQFGSLGKQSAEQLAVSMLRQMPDGESAQRQQIIEHCRRLLEEVGATASSIRGQASPQWDGAAPIDASDVPHHSQFATGQLVTGGVDVPPENAPRETGRRNPPVAPKAFPPELTHLPGGGLAPGGSTGHPGELFSTDRSSGGLGSSTGLSAGRLGEGQSWAVADQRAEGGPGKEASPTPGRLPAPAQPPKTLPRAGSEWQPDAGGVVRPLTGADGSGAHSVQKSWRSADERPSAADERPSGPILPGQQPPSASGGGAKSRDQHLPPVEIELARRAAHPDPQVRKQLVRLLPQLQAVDSTAWLLRLCEDEDPEVRWEAMALLATSNNPAVTAQVRKLARQDSNPRIRQLAEQLDRR